MSPKANIFLFENKVKLMNDITEQVKEFFSQNAGYTDFFVIDGEGNVEFKYGEEEADVEELKGLLNAWKNTEPAAIFRGNRYPILKWDPLQFAATSVKTKYSLIGSTTKTKKYCVAHFTGGGNAIMNTINLNRFVWNLI